MTTATFLILLRKKRFSLSRSHYTLSSSPPVLLFSFFLYPSFASSPLLFLPCLLLLPPTSRPCAPWLARKPTHLGGLAPLDLDLSESPTLVLPAQRHRFLPLSIMAPPPRLRILSGKSSRHLLSSSPIMGRPIMKVCAVGGNAISAFLSWRLQATTSCDVTLVWKSGFEAVAQYGVSFKYVHLCTDGMIHQDSRHAPIDRSKAFGNERFKPRHGTRLPISLSGTDHPPVDLDPRG